MMEVGEMLELTKRLNGINNSEYCYPAQKKSQVATVYF